MKKSYDRPIFSRAAKGLVRFTLSDSFRTLPRLSILPILFTLAGKRLTACGPWCGRSSPHGGVYLPRRPSAAAARRVQRRRLHCVVRQPGAGGARLALDPAAAVPVYQNVQYDSSRPAATCARPTGRLGSRRKRATRAAWLARWHRRSLLHSCRCCFCLSPTALQPPLPPPPHRRQPAWRLEGWSSR